MFEHNFSLKKIFINTSAIDIEKFIEDNKDKFFGVNSNLTYIFKNKELFFRLKYPTNECFTKEIKQNKQKFIKLLIDTFN